MNSELRYDTTVVVFDDDDDNDEVEDSYTYGRACTASPMILIYSVLLFFVYFFSISSFFAVKHSRVMYLAKSSGFSLPVSYALFPDLVCPEADMKSHLYNVIIYCAATAKCAINELQIFHLSEMKATA